MKSDQQRKNKIDNTRLSYQQMSEETNVPPHYFMECYRHPSTTSDNKKEIVDNALEKIKDNRTQKYSRNSKMK